MAEQLTQNKSGGARLTVVGNNNLLGGTVLPIISRLNFRVNVKETPFFTRSHGLNGSYFYFARIKFDGLEEWFMFDYLSTVVPRVAASVSRDRVDFFYTAGSAYPDLLYATVEVYFLGLKV